MYVLLVQNPEIHTFSTKIQRLKIKRLACVQMCAEPVSQRVFHKVESVKCALVFNRTKNLDSGDFCYLHVFWELLVECGRCGDFAPKPGHWIEVVLRITHDNLRAMDPGHLEMGALQIQIVRWQQCRDSLPIWTNFGRHTKGCLQVRVKIIFCLYSVCSQKLWVDDT